MSKFKDLLKNISDIKDDEVPKFRTWGALNTEGLESRNREIIQEIESSGEIKVLAVVNSAHRIDGKVVFMVNYITDSYCDEYSNDEYYCSAYVDNRSWDIQEYGDVILKVTRDNIIRTH